MGEPFVISEDQTLIEIQFLAYMIPVILGTELGVYFFYQYRKSHSTNLRLNRILLSYGSFTLFMVNGALFQVINRLFYESRNDVLASIGLVGIFLAPISFIAFITIKEFSIIINLKVARIVIAASVIPIILLFMLGLQNIVFRLSLTVTVLNAYFVITYQVKLIRVSMGIIKSRIMQIFIGEVLVLLALLSALLFYGRASVSFFLVDVFLLSIGFLTMFWAVNDFPPFYEFDWKANLFKLFIIDEKHNQFLYARDFTRKLETKTSVEGKERDQMRDELFSGAIAGIENMISTITDSRSQKLSKIDQCDSFILLEYGQKFPTPITYALVVKKDLSSLRHFVMIIKEQFESFFTEILKQLDQISIQGKINRFFESFDIILNNLMNK